MLALVMLPLLGAALVRPLGAVRQGYRDVLIVSVSVMTLLGAVALAFLTRGAYPLTASVPFLLGEATFALDLVGHMMVVLIAFVWACCALHAVDYLASDSESGRYHAAALVTLGVTLGVVVAGDLVTLFLFFELMGVLAYLLVVHKRTGQAERAAAKYLVMTLGSGFVLLAGILLTLHIGGDGTLSPVVTSEEHAPLRWLAASLMVLGFGVKAGMLPVHIWLPDAHSVAPSPASALLSGVLIKIGAYGIFRTLFTLYGPAGGQDPLPTLGLALLVLGLAGMVAGVLIALPQKDMKRMLAYSSVSQIGFVLAGLGAAAYLAGDRYAAYGISGGLYHVVNHALYKAVLFLGAGAVLTQAGSVDLGKLGGLRTRMPLTFTAMLVAAAGTVGLPLFNGFASKSLIHHAVEAADPVALFGVIGPMEAAFVIAGGGTFAVLAKLLWSVFGGPVSEECSTVTEAPALMLVAMTLLCSAVIALGVAPLLLLRGVLTPVTQGLGLDVSVLIAYRQFTWEHIGYAALAVAAGAGIIGLDARFGVSRLTLPRWASADAWYARGVTAAGGLAGSLTEAYEGYLVAVSQGIRSAFARLTLVRYRMRRFRQRFTATILEGSPGSQSARVLREIFDVLDEDREKTIERAAGLADARQQQGPACPGRGCEEYTDAVRNIVRYVTRRLRTERIAVASVVVQHEPERALEVVKATLRDVGDDTAEMLVEASHELALHRMSGHDVTPGISALVVEVLRAEEFSSRIEGMMPTASQSRRIRESDGAQGAGAHGGALAWIADIARLVVVAFTRERTDWGQEEPEEERVVSLRRTVAALTGDLDLAMVVMVVGLLLFIAVAG